MRLTLFIGLLLTMVISIHGQPNSQCATIGTEQEKRYMKYLERLADSLNPLRIYEDNVVKVAMYRFRYDDGSGARTDAEFAAEINNLNSYFNNNDICFSLVRIENVDNSSYLEVDWGDSDVADSMKTVLNSNHPSFSDAVTIYVLPPSVWYRGSSYGIPSTALLMTSSTNNKWGTSHIAHEMGHVLGNFHTHDDLDGAKLEFVNRIAFCNLIPLINDQGAWFDCCVGADGLCDTPSDPNLGDTTSYGVWRVNADSCLYVDTAWTDIFGDTPDPMVSNIMSYAPPSCRTEFTGQQWDRMHLTLDLNAEFNNKQVSTTRQLNGETISSGHRHEMAKQTIVVSNNSNYEVIQSGQVTHEAEQYVDLLPGFKASPTNTTGFYVGRAKDICDNSTLNDYAYHPTDADLMLNGSFGEGLISEDERIIDSIPTENATFGNAVAIDGDYLVIGHRFAEIGDSTNQGKVDVFHYNGTSWVKEATLYADDAKAGHQFGTDVDIDGDRIAVSALYAGTDTDGKVYIFERSGNTWIQTAAWSGGAPSYFDRFGESIDLDGHRIIIGVPGKDHNMTFNAGAAYLYEYEMDSIWVEVATIVDATPVTSTYMGTSVALDGNLAVVGSEKPVVYFLKKSGDTWVIHDEVVSGTSFGDKVDIENTTVAISYPDRSVNGNPKQGSCIVFHFDGDSSYPTDTLIALDGESNDRFGKSVDIFAGRIAVSLQQKHIDGVQMDGRTYVFRRLNETWIHDIIAHPSDSDPNGGFGNDVSMTYQHISVAASIHDLPGLANAGAIYIYSRE